VSPHTLRHAFITAALDAGVPLRDVQEAASHADPRTTMRYDRARVSLDRHATYIVAAFVAGAARQDPHANPADASPSDWCFLKPTAKGWLSEQIRYSGALVNVRTFGRSLPSTSLGSALVDSPKRCVRSIPVRRTSSTRCLKRPHRPARGPVSRSGPTNQMGFGNDVQATGLRPSATLPVKKVCLARGSGWNKQP
jgi:hypothetical protein